MSNERGGLFGFLHRGHNEYEISVPDLRQRLADGPPVAIIDCREQFEIARGGVFESGRHIPLGQVASHLEDIRMLAQSADVIIVCAHGHRSLHAARYLRNEGIPNAWSLSGGTKAWK